MFQVIDLNLLLPMSDEIARKTSGFSVPILHKHSSKSEFQCFIFSYDTEK